MINEMLFQSILKSAFNGNLTKQKNEEQVDIIPQIYNKDFKNIVEVNELDLPQNWKQFKLGNVITLISGQDLESTRYFSNYRENSIPYLTGASNIENDNVIINRYTDTPTSTAVKEDILLTCKGTIGTSIILKEEIVHIARQFMAIKPEQLNNEYLLYFLKSKVFDMQNNSKSMIPGIDRNYILNLTIPIPPLEEQKRIANKIYQSVLKLNEISIVENEMLELKNNFKIDIKNSILLSAFSGKLTKSNLDEWETDKIEKVCNEIFTGNSISESIKKSKYTNIEDGYNYIGTKDLNFDHTFCYENGVKIPFDEKGFKYAKCNDILMCIEGGSAGKKIGILEEKVCYGNKLCKFEINEDLIIPKFMYYYLQSPIFLQNFYDNLSGLIGGVSINKIKSIVIQFPSIDEQKNIISKLDEILPIIDDIENILNQ